MAAQPFDDLKCDHLIAEGIHLSDYRDVPEWAEHLELFDYCPYCGVNLHPHPAQFKTAENKSGLFNQIED